MKRVKHPLDEYLYSEEIAIYLEGKRVLLGSGLQVLGEW